MKKLTIKTEKTDNAYEVFCKGKYVADIIKEGYGNYAVYIDGDYKNPFGFYRLADAKAWLVERLNSAATATAAATEPAAELAATAAATETADESVAIEQAQDVAPTPIESINPAKIYTVITERQRGNDLTQTGTLAELINAYSYTLECGKSYEFERGAKKVNRAPKTIKSLLLALNNAAINIRSYSNYRLQTEPTSHPTAPCVPSEPNIETIAANDSAENKDNSPCHRQIMNSKTMAEAGFHAPAIIAKYAQEIAQNSAPVPMKSIVGKPNGTAIITTNEGAVTELAARKEVADSLAQAHAAVQDAYKTAQSTPEYIAYQIAANTAIDANAKSCDGYSEKENKTARYAHKAYTNTTAHADWYAAIDAYNAMRPDICPTCGAAKNSCERCLQAPAETDI